jgi:hypothetical protein
MTDIIESDESWQASEALLKLEEPASDNYVVAQALNKAVASLGIKFDQNQKKSYASCEEYSQEEIADRYKRMLGTANELQIAEAAETFTEKHSRYPIETELAKIEERLAASGDLHTIVGTAMTGWNESISKKHGNLSCTGEGCKVCKAIEEIKAMPDSGMYGPVTPRYSKAQIGQALANQKRALKAGNKLRRKQKAQANKYKSY